MAEDSGFRDIKRKPKPGWERWRPPPPDRWTRAGFRGKTVWDWLELLIVPLMLALITVAFTWQQSARQNDIEARRAQAERERAEQRAQDEALQAYLDEMTQLILDRKLLEAGAGDSVYTLAQARTTTTIARLDAEHDESVLRFLADSGLAEAEEPSVRLLEGIEMQGAQLSDANLLDFDLSEADLSGAHLSGALLSAADLRGADLSAADLRSADLAYADLSEDDYMNFGADLSKADLTYAHLTDADLSYAFLNDADLSNAFLDNVVLIDTDLTGAEGVTNEKLEQKAASLEGATMPNGQKYEDWLKHKEGSK